MAFPSTNWTQVAQATLNGDTSSRRALSQLCADYREPLIAFLGSRGHDRHASEDLVQDFYLRLLESQAWKRADRARGKFRTFLLATLLHVTDHARTKAGAAKRGGGAEHDSLDLLEECGFEPSEISPDIERRFDSEWAYGMIKNTLHALVTEFAADGRADEFAALRCFLPGADTPPLYEELASRLGQPEGSLRVKVHRLRQRFRELLRSAVARTVSGPHEVDEELGYLRRLLSGVV
jgi:RNA polymerase sigma-70 factor (ECF subfamily)